MSDFNFPTGGHAAAEHYKDFAARLLRQNEELRRRNEALEREKEELRKERDEARLWESKYKADLDISAQWHTEEEARAETAERQLAEQKKLRKEDMLAFEATQMKRDEQNILLRHQLAERDADLARKNEALLGIANSIRDGLTENSLPDHRIKIGEGNHIEGGWLLGPGAALIRNMLVAIRDLAEQAASAGSGSGGWPVPDGWKLVPVELTQAMIIAYNEEFEKLSIEKWANALLTWPVLLSNAPPLPASPSTAGER